MEKLRRTCRTYRTMDEARAAIRALVPGYTLDFIGVFDGPTGQTACWHIGIAADHRWVGALYEHPDGQHVVEFRPGLRS